MAVMESTAVAGTQILGNVMEAIGNTPLIRINKIAQGVKPAVLAKVEFFNPGGSVKDRIGPTMIEDAERQGLLRPGGTIVEATSGNTGVGLAIAAAIKGYKTVFVMPDKMSDEKIRLLRAFGARVVITPTAVEPDDPRSYYSVAKRIAEETPNAILAGQYWNPANPETHYRTTGPEIWRQTEGAVTHFVAGLGTCGTITGTGRFLKEKNPGVKVLGAYPGEGHDIPGVRSLRQLKLTSFYLPQEYDGQVEVSDEEAYELTLRLNREESIIAGPSSGMALAGAIKQVPDEPGVVAVVIFTDNVFKYTTSMQRHFPSLFPAPEVPAAAAASEDAHGWAISQLLDNARRSGDVIDVGEMESLLDSPERPVVLDVRSSAEFAELERVEGAVNLPLADIAAGAPNLPRDLGAPIVTVCNVGRQSLTALLVLKSLGYKNVRNLAGGMTAWMGEGMPVERG